MNKSLIHLSLRNHALLTTLSASEYDMVISHVEYERFSKNKMIYDINTEMRYVYLIEKGNVKLGMHSSCGKTLAKDIIYDNEIFGENIFVPELKTQEFAETLSETGLFKIPIDVFRDLVVNNHKFTGHVMNVVVHKLQKLEDRLQNFVFRKAKERIIDFICKTGKRKGITIGISECLIDHGMSHSEISYLTDTSRQTVARILNELKRDNHIHFTSRKSGKILVRDITSLQKYAYAEAI
jgi:CRP/FNR family transcriptional regulator, cyclic AMP receptor protein